EDGLPGAGPRPPLRRRPAGPCPDQRSPPGPPAVGSIGPGSRWRGGARGGHRGNASGGGGGKPKKPPRGGGAGAAVVRPAVATACCAWARPETERGKGRRQQVHWFSTPRLAPDAPPLRFGEGAGGRGSSLRRGSSAFFPRSASSGFTVAGRYRGWHH